MAVPYFSSTAALNEPSQFVANINTLITSINANQLTVGGSGVLSSLIIGGGSSLLNLVGLNPAGSAAPVTIQPAGSSVQQAASIIVTVPSTGQVGLGGTGTLASAGLLVNANSTSINAILVTGGQSGSPAVIQVGGSSANTSPNLAILAGSTLGQIQIGGTTAGAAQQTLTIATAATQVNGITITGASTAVPATMQATGSDANPNLSILAGGSTGAITLGGAGSLSASLTIASVSGGVNGITITGATSGGGVPSIAATGSDTNINLTLQTKGTGILKLGNSTMMTANGAVAMSTSASLPTGTTSSTPVKWLTLLDPAGTIKYQVPLWA